MKYQQTNIFKIMLFCLTLLFLGLMNTSVAHAGLVLPVANFSSNITEGYPPLDVQFTNLSTNATDLEWNFGDGSSNVTDPNPEHLFTFTGSFDVVLTASNRNGSDSKTITINVSEKPKAPKANFTSNVTSGLAPLSVQFTDQSEEADDLEWNFGDGSSDVYDSNPVHVFTSPGVFIVTLIATNMDGSNSKSMEITVYDKSALPVANFTSNVTDGFAPLDVQFYDYSENATWSNWDFGDGISYNGDASALKSPIHTYIGDGSYTVNLTVSNANGSDSKLATITVSAPSAPVADFTSNVTSGKTPLTVQFNDSSIGAPTNWYWDFGDGTYVYGNAFGDNVFGDAKIKNPVHTYTGDGNYTVNLTVSNAKGTDSKLATINVTTSYTFVTKWGSLGNGNGQFDMPGGVAVDASGNVYVSDLFDRIQKFDCNGTFLTKWGSPGREDGQLGIPCGVAIDSQNKVFVVDMYNHRIQKFDNNGNFITKWGSEGYGNGQFENPNDIAVDSSGNVYVTDSQNHCIQKFDNNGNFLTKWDSSHNPYGIAVDSKGYVYVAYVYFNSIQKFDSNGTLITQWGSYGTGNGQFKNPWGVAVDSSDNVYVCDYSNYRIQKFDSNGTYLDKWGSFGSGNGQFNYAANVAIDSSGNVYVADANNSRIQKFAPIEKPAPVANFISNVSQGSVPLSIQFTDLSKNVNAWYWDFGDGNTSTERNPMHTYYKEGKFTVTLTVSNEKVTDSKLATIKVSLPVVAKFVANVTGGNVPLSVNFTDLSENANAWHWEFGDGNTSIEQNPIYTYNKKGNYTVNLTAMNTSGLFDTYNQSIYVHGFLPDPNGYSFENFDDKRLHSTGDFHNIYNIDVDVNRTTSPETYFYNNYFINASDGGNCFGMSSTSLLLYNHQINNTYNYKINDGLPIEWASLSNFPKDYLTPAPPFVNMWICDYQTLWCTKACLDDFCTYSGVQKVYDTLSEHLSNGKYDMVMYFNGSYYNNTSKSYDGFAHAVVPYRIDESSDGQSAKIYVYDPNSPGDLNECFDVSKTAWTISDYFSDITYVSDISTVSLYSLKAITEPPQMPSDVYSINQCPAHLLFTDSSGRKLGYDNGVLKYEIPGTCPIVIPNTETDTNLKESYYVPVPSIKMELYGRGNGISETSMITPNGLIVANVPVTTSSVDEFKVLNNGTGVYFNSENSNTPLLDLMLDVETPKHAQTVNAGISQIEAYGSVNLSNINGIIILQNNGLARTCNMSIEQATGTQYSSVTINNITIEASSTIYIEPSDWNNLSGSTVIIKHDVGSDGTIDYIQNGQQNPIPLILPVANFTSNVTQGYAPLSVQFNNTSIGAPTDWYWDFGDGTNSTKLNPMHLYSTVGNYTVNLTVSNSNGTSSKTAQINVSNIPAQLILPIANFTSNATSGSAPLTVLFNDSSLNATWWNWDFGDGTNIAGNNSSTKSPMHLYSTAGNYTVNLTVSNANGTSSNTTQINVSAPVISGLPVANFTSTVSQGYAPLSVNFTDLSKNANAWNWDFGDGANSTQQNTRHEYTMPGTYTVNLTVSNANGTDSKVATIYIYEPYYLVKKWVHAAIGNQQYIDPSAITLDTLGNVFVVDMGNHSVRKFTNNGIFITTWGYQGSGDGQFFTPLDIAIDSSGNVYVCDWYNQRIQKFDGSGTFLTKWGSQGSGNGQFLFPCSIAVDSLGNVYVIDWDNHRIQKFDSNGRFLIKWGSYGSGDGQFKNPMDIDVDFSGNVYVSDAGNDCIQKFDNNGNFITKWGSEGYGNGQFEDPDNIAVDSSGNVYVADVQIDTSCIQKFTSNGTFITKWGSYGEADGQFQNIGGIAVDSLDNVYVADKVGYPHNLRIQVFSLSKPVPPVANFSTNETSGYSPLTVQFTDLSTNATGWKWDFGDGNISYLQSPQHTFYTGRNYTVNMTVNNTIGADSKVATISVLQQSAKILPVANFTNNVTQGYAPLVVQFTDLSTNATEWNWDFGDGANSTERNVSHTYTAAGSFTVNLTVSNANGTSSKTAQINSKLDTIDIENYTFVRKWGSYGSGDGQFSSLKGVAVDFSGNVYVPDSYNLIKIFNSTGAFITKWIFSGYPYPEDLGFDSFGNVYVVQYSRSRIDKLDSSGKLILQWGSNGSSNGQFYLPWTIAIDSKNNVYVLDTGNNRIQKFDSNGNFTTKWGSQGSGDGQFIHPLGIAVDSSGNVYASDDNNRIQKFDSNGTFLTKWGSYGTADGQFRGPRGLDVDSSGNVFVVDMSNYRVQKFDSNGTFLTKWGSYGTADGQFNNPIGVAVDFLGNVYVTDWNNYRVQKFGRESSTVHPVANFTSNVTSGNVPLTVQFTDLSTNATGWKWDFGDGNASYVQSPQHTFYAVRDYAVNLTVNNTNGTDSKVATISVLQQPSKTYPVANFTSNVTQGYAPLDVKFTNLSSNETHLEWNFGDGSLNVSDSNPEHLFTSTGQFNVVLTASNGNGSDSKSMTINVTSNPVLPVLPTAVIGTNTTNGIVPLTVQFSDLSLNATGRIWEFGDGEANSIDVNPIHTYNLVGTFTVNLIASNGNGSDSKYVVINVTSKPLQPVFPIANLSSNVTEGYAPLDVQFTDLSKNVTGWKWEFGDGNNSSEQSPIHIYSAPGTYTINLTASNSNGSDSKFMTINVTPKPVLIIPVANFSSNVNEGYAPLDVQFIDLSQNATHLEWNFGDGSTNVSYQNPEHLFTSAGQFTVVLTASNGNGSDSKSITINVTSKPVQLVFPVAKFSSNILQQPVHPVANFISNVTGGLVPLSVQFTDQSINATGWNWDFGDGNISTDQSPMHTYYTAGNYTVNLTVSNGNFRDSKLAVINVSAQNVLLVIQSVNLFPANITAGSKINVTVAADNFRVVGVTAGNTSLTKDNNGSWQGNITAPLKTGKYSLLINANDVAGSIWNTSMPYNVVQLQGGAYIKILPKSSTANTVYAPISVQFTDLSEYATGWRWDFGDGNNSTDRSPMHTYSTSGNYTVNLTVSNANGTNSTSAIVNAPTISARNLVSLNIQVTNTQNIDDTFKLRISVSELPVSSQSDLNWFSWTDNAISLRAGQTGQVPVYVTIPANTATGLKAFRANTTSGVSKITGFDTGYLTIK